MNMEGFIQKNQVQAVLANRLPAAFVKSFMSDKGHGITHGKKVFGLATDISSLAKIEISSRHLAILQWACLLHDIADIKDRAEYFNVFSAFQASEESLSPILSGLAEGSARHINNQVMEFHKALESNGRLRPYHHLTAAVFIYEVLKDNGLLGKAGSRLAAQAALFHSERNLSLVPDALPVCLLKDADKIAGIDLERLFDINVNQYGRAFFDPSISMDLRIEILKGQIRPEEQEARDLSLRLDTFQFAGVRTLFLDTNPLMFKQPDIIEPYIFKNKLFDRFLRLLLDAINKYNPTDQLKNENLSLLCKLLAIARKMNEYGRNVSLITKGMQLVDSCLYANKL